jgi:hypothetical protein
LPPFLSFAALKFDLTAGRERLIQPAGNPDRFDFDELRDQVVNVAAFSELLPFSNPRGCFPYRSERCCSSDA